MRLWAPKELFHRAADFFRSMLQLEIQSWGLEPCGLRALSMPAWLMFCSTTLVPLDFGTAVMPRSVQNGTNCFILRYPVLSSFPQ